MITVLTSLVGFFACFAVMRQIIIHYRHIHPSLLAGSENGQGLKQVLRRFLLLLAIFAAVPLLLTQIPDPWSTLYPLSILTESFSVEGTDPLNILASPEDAWRPLPSAGFRSFGAERREFWFKAEIPPGKAETLYATNRSDTAGKIEFYLIVNNKIIDHHSAGLSEPISHPRSVFPTFEFTRSTTDQMTLLVRLKSSGFAFLPMTILEGHQESRRTLIEFLLFGVTFGVLLGVTLYNVSLYLAFRDRIYLAFALSQIASSAYFIYFSNYFNSFFRVSDQDYTISQSRTAMVLLLGAIFSYVFFLRTILDKTTNNKHFSRVIRTYVLSLCLGVCLFPFQDPFDLAMMGVFFPGLGIMAVVILAIPHLGRNFLFACLIVVTIGAAQMAARYLAIFDIISASWVTDQFLSFSVLFNGIALSFAMSHQLGEISSQRSIHLKTIQNSDGDITPDLSTTAPAQGSPMTAQPWRVSLMFADMANFSLISEKIGSVAVYQRLSAQMEAMRAIIQEHGGIVDRSLGDGLLCFFTEEHSEHKSPHTERAFQAAIAIQKYTLSHFTEKIPTSAPLMPIRIGLHCDEVLIGNLGWADRIDFTMLGKGVIHAQRLEAACSPFRVMLSDTFYTALNQPLTWRLGISEIHLARDPSGKWLKAFEYNPFTDQAQLLDEAEDIFARSLDIYPHEMRHKFTLDHSPYATVDGKRFRISDFSLSGLGITGDVYIARSVKIRLQILHHDGSPLLAIRERHLDDIEVEVRWSRNQNGQYRHGLKYLGLNDPQKDFLFQFFTNYHQQSPHSHQTMTANLG